MLCANNPFSNSFQCRPIQTEVLFFNFYILQAAAAIEDWLQAKYCSHWSTSFCYILNLPSAKNVAHERSELDNGRSCRDLQCMVYNSYLFHISLFLFHSSFFISFIFSLSIFVLIILASIQTSRSPIFIIFFCPCLNWITQKWFYFVHFSMLLFIFLSSISSLHRSFFPRSHVVLWFLVSFLSIFLHCLFLFLLPIFFLSSLLPIFLLWFSVSVSLGVKKRHEITFHLFRLQLNRWGHTSHRFCQYRSDVMSCTQNYK
jgi:hypothetical protein